jgi:hypothetical protein
LFKLTPESDREPPIFSAYDRPPRAAAPLPGQLREDGPLKPTAAMEQPAERVAAAKNKRKAPAEALAPTAAARTVGAPAKKKQKKPSAAAAATAAPQVYAGELEQIEEAAAYRLAAGALRPYCCS